MKLSIISINKDNAEGLHRTMESVLAQTCKDFEYIVVDGASTDGSVQVMDEWASSIRAAGIPTDAVSEPDTGLYNAMNKGVRKSHGEYTLMLNSGDWFVDEHVVEKVLSLLDGTDIIQGNVIRLRDGKEVLDRGYGRSEISFRDVYKGFFLHQASFIKTSTWAEYGPYDESFLIGADTVFFLRALGFGHASFRYVDCTIAKMETGGISTLPSQSWRDIRSEEDKRYEALLPPRLLGMCLNEEKKVRFYDSLHRRKWIWSIAVLLERLSLKMSK